MLQISADISLQNTENHLGAINREPDQKFILPLNLRGKSLGAEAALLQLLITWAQTARRPTLNLPVQELSENQIDDFVRNLHGLAASLLCSSAKDLRDNEYFDRLQANGLVKLRELDGSEPLNALHRLHNFALVCADHLGRKDPRLLYLNKKVREEDYFRKLSKWIVRWVTPDAYRSDLTKSLGDALGSMLHEVFENTDEHAVTDLDNTRLSKSLRGLFAKHHQLAERQIAELTENNAALRQFCERSPKSGNLRRLFELSVFDSGPGLAQRISKKKLWDLSLEDEFEAVQSCFRKDVSTKTRSGHGAGLHHVLSLLHENRGFIRIRTGRLALFGDLNSFQPEQGELNLSLRDLSGGKISRLAKASGTLITILVPLTKS